MKSTILFICCFIPIKKVRKRVRINLFRKADELRALFFTLSPLKKHYDFIVSIGDCCQISYQLRRSGLQVRSYPFDWLCSKKKLNWFNIVLNDFEGFLDKKNFKKCSSFFDNKHCGYENIKYGLIFMHDFDKNLSIDETFEEVKEKYSRRILRLQKNIEKSRKILFVFRNDKLSETEILQTYLKISKKFSNKEIDFLWIKKGSDSNIITYNSISDHIKQALFDCDTYKGENPKVNGWRGNVKLYDELFKGISISFRTLLNNIKKETK